MELHTIKVDKSGENYIGLWIRNIVFLLLLQFDCRLNNTITET